MHAAAWVGRCAQAVVTDAKNLPGSALLLKRHEVSRPEGASTRKWNVRSHERVQAESNAKEDLEKEAVYLAVGLSAAFLESELYGIFRGHDNTQPLKGGHASQIASSFADLMREKIVISSQNPGAERV